MSVYVCVYISIALVNYKNYFHFFLSHNPVFSFSPLRVSLEVAWIQQKAPDRSNKKYLLYKSSPPLGRLLFF